MSPTLNAGQLLEQEFLLVRAKLLEIASALDRIERAEGSVESDPRVARIQEGIAVLATKQTDKAEQLQILFSLPYEEGWFEKFEPTR